MTILRHDTRVLSGFRSGRTGVGPAAGGGLRVRFLAALLACTWAVPSSARVYMTVDEAMARAFPDGEIKRSSVFLTDDQHQRAEALAGVEIPSKVVHVYEVARAGRRIGTAYFDAHRVRTLSETVMVTVDTSGVIAAIEVLSFNEPEDYLPRRAWYDQFPGRGLDADLQLHRGIDGVTGATLTGRATTSAARRILALHRILSEDASP